MSTPPVVLTIGGSDSGGCYGVQADLRLLAAQGVHATCAITVVTAQNTGALSHAQLISPDVVAAQIDAVTSDFDVAAVKTGLLGRVEIIELVAERTRAGMLPNLVVDPVVVNRHGAALFGQAVLDAYRDLLIPLARVITPNAPEAALLCGFPLGDRADIGRAVRRFGVPSVITAGRSGGAALDVFWDGRAALELDGPWVATTNNAGSGDVFSAAIAAALARGRSLNDAVHGAKATVTQALIGAAGWQLGSGPGPLDALGWTPSGT